MSRAGPALRPEPGGPPAIDVLAATFGLDTTGAEVVRSATRHVVRFPASGIRTFAVRDAGHGPRDEVTTAALLADAGVPAARHRAGPAVVDGWSVTAWQEVPDVDPTAAVGPEVLGRLAARLHGATGGLDPRGLVACDPVGAALGQVEAAVRAGATPEGDLDVLRAAATRLDASWQDAVAAAREQPDDPVAGAAVVHGDLHPGNVVVGRDGPVLVDLELAGWGPRALDAAPTVVLVRWYGHDRSDLAAFDAAYGAPLCAAAVEHGLDDVWALWATAWSVANRHRSPEAEEEAATRVAALTTGSAPRPWRLT